MDSTTFIIETDGEVDIRKPLFNLLAAKGWYLIGLEAGGTNIEDVFLALTEKNPEGKSKKKARTEIKGA